LPLLELELYSVIVGYTVLLNQIKHTYTFKIRCFI